MYDNITIIGKLDETLTGLEKAVKNDNKSQVNLEVTRFTKLIGDCPGILEERDLTKYGKKFQQVMENFNVRERAKSVVDNILNELHKSEKEKIDEQVELDKRKFKGALSEYKEILGPKKVKQYLNKFSSITRPEEYLPDKK